MERPKPRPHPEAYKIIWADGEDYFLLTLDDLRALQESTSYGPFVLLRRLTTLDAHLDEWRDIIRRALIGAGYSAIEAQRKITRCVDRRPMAESVVLAAAILERLMHGPDYDPVVVKKKDGEEDQAESTSADASASQPSSGPEPSSGSRRRKSAR